jgi:Arc/MetJ-type ribon-helix-helix transcriptional regulator
MPRITIEFPEQIDKILKELAEKGETSKVDVLRRALALYNYVNKEVKEKDLKLAVADNEDKILKEIILDL